MPHIVAITESLACLPSESRCFHPPQIENYTKGQGLHHVVRIMLLQRAVALYIKEIYQLGQSSQELPLFPVKTQNKNFKFKDQTRQETVEKGAVMERYQLGGGSAVIHESPEILTN